MNIVFMGSPDFAIPSLAHLHASEHTVSAVVSGKDKRRGRGSGTSPTPVKAKALSLGLPVVEVEDLGSQVFHEQLERLEPDLLVVVAFRILPPSILEIPAKGSINLHASLLPKYRGAAPIHWAVMEGETETGCTIFFLDEQVDTGQIIAQQKVAIGPNETTGDVYDRLKRMGGGMVVDTVGMIEEEQCTRQKQDDAEATQAPKLFTEDCKVDFHQPARKVHNKIRGLSPFPTAWATLDGLKFNMYRSQEAPDVNLKPGTLEMRGDALVIGCETGAVMLDDVQLEGKRRMKGKDFMNGYNGTGMVH